MDNNGAYHHLMVACVGQALDDARQGDAGAREWLLDTGAEWADGLGVEQDLFLAALPRLIKNGRSLRRSLARGDVYHSQKVSKVS